MNAMNFFHRFGFFALALLLAIAVASLGVTSFQHKVEGFQPLGFEADSSGDFWQVTSVDHAGTRLQAGDLILHVNGDKPRSFHDLRNLLTARPQSRVLCKREGALHIAEYQRPDLSVDAPYLVLTVCGLLYLLIGLFTAFKDRQRQAQLFYLWCLVSAALYILSPPAVPASFSEKAIFVADQLALDLLPALTLHLFLVFPATLGGLRFLSAAIPFVYLPPAVLISLHADLMLGGPLFGPPTANKLYLLQQLELLQLLTFSFLAILALAIRLARRGSWEQRRQVQWILLGMLGGYTPFLLFYAVPNLLRIDTPQWLTTLAVLPLGLVPLAFAYAILKYKLWDIGVILRDSIAYTLTTIVGLLGFSLINLAISRGVADDLSPLRNLLTFAAGLAIAGVLVPTKSAISSGLERLQFRSTLGKRHALSALGEELLHKRDLDSLCETLLERLTEGLEVDRTNLYLGQGGAMVPVLLEEKVPRSLSFDAFGDDFWERDVAGVSGLMVPGNEASEQQRLFQCGYRYALPLRVREHCVGVVLLSYKFTEAPLSSEDIDLARGMLNQAALALENAQLLEEVHRKLDEVTRLKEHSRGIIESSPAGIAALDEDDRVTSANHAFAAIVGQERRLLSGSPIGELLPIRPLPAMDSGLMEVSYCEMSGRERYLQLSVADYQGPGSGLRILVVQDVSERVAMETALKEKERLASLGMLAAGVAHEVNTPLTGISSYAQMLLADTAEGDPHYALLKKMERQTFRAAQIVNNLLEFARNRQDELMPVILDGVIDECVELLGERAARAGVVLDWQPEGCGLTVLGNEGELHQVLTNLVVNAIDAIGTDGGQVTVRVTGNGRNVEVRVTDDGPGIPPERLERVFQPFFSGKSKGEGTGLGLAICYNIVRRHGGMIRAENGPRAEGGGRPGCTFLVSLPHHLHH